jgi:hypothetical protein
LGAWEGGRVLVATEHGTIKTTLAARHTNDVAKIGSYVVVEAALHCADLELGVSRSAFASTFASPLRPATPTMDAGMMQPQVGPLSLNFKALMLRAALLTREKGEQDRDRLLSSHPVHHTHSCHGASVYGRGTLRSPHWCQLGLDAPQSRKRCDGDSAGPQRGFP